MLDDTTQAGGNQTNRWRGTLEKLAGEHEASVGAKRNGVHQVRGEGSEVDGTQMSQEDEAVGLTYSICADCAHTAADRERELVGAIDTTIAVLKRQVLLRDIRRRALASGRSQGPSDIIDVQQAAGASVDSSAAGCAHWTE